MGFYLNLFSPETHKAFSNSEKNISGFTKSQMSLAKKIKPGDRFICYLTKLSRWVGIFEVESEVFTDNTPIFKETDDPYTTRFKVKPIVWLDFEYGIPIHEDIIWNKLSFTKDHNKTSNTWTGKLRSSLTTISKADAEFLESTLLAQAKEMKRYPLTELEKKKIKSHKVKTQHNREVEVYIPDDENEEEILKNKVSRESIIIQAKIAKIGERMGLKIWIPKADRTRVLEHWTPYNGVLLEQLPLNYDDTTLSTIEQIDVLWIKGRSIVRAFEVEHTTSIYSGILRMADLMALQPNLDIKAHIVAPLERREKVLQEINRPVFSLLEKGPLAESCSFIPYDSIYELEGQKFVEHMTDTVLEEYAEYNIT